MCFYAAQILKVEKTDHNKVDIGMLTSNNMFMKMTWYLFSCFYTCLKIKCIQSSMAKICSKPLPYWIFQTKFYIFRSLEEEKYHF